MDLDGAGEVLGVAGLLEVGAQPARPGDVVGAVRQPGHGRRLERGAGLVDVSERHRLVLEDVRDVAGGDGAVRRRDPSPAVDAAAHLDERLGLEDAEGLAQSGPRDPELARQRGLAGERLTGTELAADDPAADVRRHQLGGLGDAQRGALGHPPLQGGDHRRSRRRTAFSRHGALTPLARFPPPAAPRRVD